MKIEFEGDTAIRAYKMSEYWAFNQQLSMYAVFSKPFTHETVNDTVLNSKGEKQIRCKALLKFPDTSKDEIVYVKVGVSAVDWDGAKKNLMAEIPGWEFDAVRDAAKDKWNSYLATHRHHRRQHR